MKPSWKTPTISKIVCPALLLAIAISTQPRVVITTQQGTIAMQGCTITGSMTVRPAGVVLR
jgi:hypothetical protein